MTTLGQFPLPTVHDVQVDSNNSSDDETCTIKHLFNLSTTLDEIIKLSIKGKWSEKVGDILVNRITRIRYHQLKKEKQHLEVLCCYCGCELTTSANAAREKSNEQISKAREILNQKDPSKYSFSMANNPWLGDTNKSEQPKNENRIFNNNDTKIECNEKNLDIADTSTDDVVFLSQRSASSRAPREIDETERERENDDDCTEESKLNDHDLRHALLKKKFEIREKSREVKKLRSLIKSREDDFDRNGNRSRARSRSFTDSDDDSYRSSFRGRGYRGHGYKGRGRGRGGVRSRGRSGRYFPSRDREFPFRSRSRSPVSPHRSRSRSKSKSRATSEFSYRGRSTINEKSINQERPSRSDFRSSSITRHKPVSSNSKSTERKERRSTSTTRNDKPLSHQSKIIDYKSPTQKRFSSDFDANIKIIKHYNSKGNLNSKTNSTARHQRPSTTTNSNTDYKNIKDHGKDLDENETEKNLSTIPQENNSQPLKAQKASQKQDNSDKSNQEKIFRKLSDSEKQQDKSDDESDTEGVTLNKPRFKTTRKRSDFNKSTPSCY